MSAPAIGVRPRWAPDRFNNVDPTHPLSARLVAALIPIAGIGAVDLNDGATIPIISTPQHGVGAFGPHMRTGGGTEGGAIMTTGGSGKFSLQPPLSIMWVGTVYGGQATDSMIFGATHNSAGTSPYISYDIYWRAGQIMDLEGNSAGTYSNIGATIAVPNGPHVAIGVITPAARQLWVDGALNASGSGVTTINYGASATFGFHWVPWDETVDVGSVFGCVWNRALSDNEIAVLSADPFCFIRR